LDSDATVGALIVYPESKEKRPVVVVIHEIFGLSDWAQELADEVAAAGYIAVAPDLLSGMGPNGADERFSRGCSYRSRQQTESRPSDR
jgi:dienelactone hydrolase